MSSMQQQEGEVERKVRELGEEVFEKYNPGNKNQEDGEGYITKADLKAFIVEIMQAADEYEAFTDEDFDTGYSEFDADGSGRINKAEFDSFIKRFADL